jgi:hypothetical protein
MIQEKIYSFLTSQDGFDMAEDEAEGEETEDTDDDEVETPEDDDLDDETEEDSGE